MSTRYIQLDKEQNERVSALDEEQQGILDFLLNWPTEKRVADMQQRRLVNRSGTLTRLGRRKARVVERWIMEGKR